MTTKITGYQNRPVQVGTDKVSRMSDAAKGSAQAVPVGSNSPVRITDQARSLAAVEQVVHGLPIVNESRVAEIRSAIADGRYQIDPEAIADKLLRTERELNS